MPVRDRSTLTAADIMTAAPRTCSPFSTVLEASLIFRDADCGAVPVVDGGKPVGVVTDRDVALALPDHGPDLPRLPVSKIMSSGAVAVTPETGIDEVAEKLGEKGVRRLLVIDRENRLVGIIALADLAPYVPDQTVGQVVTEVVEHP